MEKTGKQSVQILMTSTKYILCFESFIIGIGTKMWLPAEETSSMDGRVPDTSSGGDFLHVSKGTEAWAYH